MSEELRDIMQITQLGLSTVGNMKQWEADKKQKAFESSYNSFYKGLETEGDKFKPDMNDPNFHADAYNKAMVDYTKAQFNQEGLKAQRFANIKAQMEQKQALLLQNAQRAESIAATDPDAAVAAYMESYNAHPNGIKATLNPKTGEYNFEDRITGQTWSEKVTLDQARQVYQGLVDKKAYAELYLTDRSRIKTFNEAAFLHPDVLENEKGVKLHAATVIDPNTDEKKTVYFTPDGQQVDVTGEELMRRGFRLAKDRAEERKALMGIKKDEADIRQSDAAAGLSREKTKHAAAESAAQIKSYEANAEESKAKAKYYEQGTPSTKKKDPVEEIMDAYGVSKAKAMDIMRSDKNFASRLYAAKDAIKAADLDPGDPDDTEAVAEIMKKFGVDTMPGQEGFGLPQVSGQLKSSHAPASAGLKKASPPKAQGPADTPQAMYTQLRSQGLSPQEARKKVEAQFK